MPSKRKVTPIPLAHGSSSNQNTNKIEDFNAGFVAAGISKRIRYFFFIKSVVDMARVSKSA